MKVLIKFIIGVIGVIIICHSFAADFDGDGTNEIGIFRESRGLWAIRGLTRLYYGRTNDRPLPGDYDGDGTVDIAIFRSSNGLWAVKDLSRVYFGRNGDEALIGVSNVWGDIWSRNGNDIFFNDGNVGIGTMIPEKMLDVNGVIKANVGDSDDWNTAYGWGNHSEKGYLKELTGHNVTELDDVSDAGSGYIVTSDERSHWDTAYGWGDHAKAGYTTQTWVEIQNYLLSENDDLQTVCDRGNNTATAMVIGGDLTVGTDQLFVDSSGNKIGIGTVSPGTILEIKDAEPVLTFGDNQNKDWITGDKLGGISFRTSDISGIGVREVAGIKIVAGSGGVTVGGEIALYTSFNNQTAAEVMRIDESGNVGIGMKNPSSKLDISGTAKMTGFRMSTGASSGYVLTSDASGNGSWEEAADGDITGVHPGDGLTGGGDEGEVTLNVDFSGTGSADTVARSDHQHDADYINEGQADSITSAMITDGQITDNDISGDASIAPSKISGTAWTGANDGAGSGLDADLLDGRQASSFGDGHSLDAADGAPANVVYVDNGGNVGIGTTSPSEKLEVNGTVKASAFQGDGSQLTGVSTIPSGVIVMWSGQTDTIPSGWKLCDGTNGTPDLSDRFIIGVTGKSVAQFEDCGPDGSTSEIDPTIRGSGDDIYMRTNGCEVHKLAPAGSTNAAAHNHYHNYFPPYFALAFIIKE